MADPNSNAAEKFNVPTNTNTDPKENLTSPNTQPIGQGKTLSDLKKESAAKLNTLDKSTKETEVAKATVVEKEAKVNHADNLVKLLAPYFDNSRQRALAQVQIENYFKENKL